MAKAANGEGTKYKLPNGKWSAAIYVPLPDGTKRRKYSNFRTRKEADEWLSTMKAEINAGKPVLCSDQTFGDFIQEWLEKFGSVGIRDSTRMNYRGYLRHILRHKVKDIKLKNLTADDLQEFILFLRNCGHLDTSDHQLSPKTIVNIINMAHTALEHAVGRRLIYQNPANFVQLPKVSKPDIKVLDDEEIGRFAAAMQGDPLQIAFVLLAFCGLRIGEACALTHKDILCANGIWYLDITKSLNRISNFEAKVGEPKTILKIQETKTAKGCRQIPMLPVVAEKVISHMQRQMEQAAKAFGLYEANPYLVSNELGGYYDPATVRKKLKAVAESVGISGFHPHTLRHTFASKAVREGVPLPYLSDCLGHTSTAFTARVYVSLDLEGKATALSPLSKLTEKVL